MLHQRVLHPAGTYLPECICCHHATVKGVSHYLPALAVDPATPVNLRCILSPGGAYVVVIQCAGAPDSAHVAVENHKGRGGG